MLKVISSIFVLILFMLWASVMYVTVNRVTVHISYNTTKCVGTSDPKLTCKDFYKNRDEFLIKFF